MGYSLTAISKASTELLPSAITLPSYRATVFPCTPHTPQGLSAEPCIQPQTSSDQTLRKAWNYFNACKGRAINDYVANSNIVQGTVIFILFKLLFVKVHGVDDYLLASSPPRQALKLTHFQGSNRSGLTPRSGRGLSYLIGGYRYSSLVKYVLGSLSVFQHLYP